MTGKQLQRPGAAYAACRDALVPIFLISALLGLGLLKPVHASESPACRLVRLSDIGWTDVTTTTALASVLLRDLGYEPQVTVLSLPVTYASMKNKDIDVFLGNWQPSMDSDRKPYIEDKSVVEVGANLPQGAKYTLAVPQYTYDKGLKDFGDIQKFKDSLKGKLFGIEAGNDGN